jgi:hypothetical protein
MKLLIISVFLITSSITFGQTNLILPNKGIDGIPIVLDSTNISEVIEFYGTDYSKSEKTLITKYQYEKIGLTFQIDPYDKNQIVRSIYIESPFQAKTENGIVLNESTMDNVLELYNEQGCFASKSYVWRPQNGITFFIKKDPKKKGYNTKEKIYKIEVHNDGEFGTSSRVNFEFNREPIKQKLKELVLILESDNVDFKKLNTFWESQKTSKKESYGLEKRTNFDRKIDNNLTQESIEIRMVGSFYNLNIIKSNDSLVYLKLIDSKEQKIILERIEKPEFGKNDYDIFTYGTFCGIGGTPPDKCQEMLGLVREKDYKELSNWLQSINPEIATYGFIGIDFLNRKGIEVLPTELGKMELLRKSEIQINTCQGCYFGVTEKISEVLTKNNLKQTYRGFEQSGWLK